MNAAVAPLVEAGLVAAVMELAGIHATLRRRGIAPLPACEQQVRLRPTHQAAAAQVCKSQWVPYQRCCCATDL